MNTVILQQPKRLVFGNGSSREAPAEFIVQGWKRLFVVTSPPVLATHGALFAGWRRAGLDVATCAAVDREPEIALFEKVLAAARECGIPQRLRDVGVPEAALPRLVKEAMKVTRLLKNNPRELTATDAEAIYHGAY